MGLKTRVLMGLGTAWTGMPSSSGALRASSAIQLLGQID